MSSHPDGNEPDPAAVGIEKREGLAVEETISGRSAAMRVGTAVAVAAPAVVLRLSGTHLPAGVQWLAPIASEAPETIVAVAFALRLRADDGMGALLAAKLNQWTLLIACLPIAYYVGGGDLAGLPLDARQTEEMVLTTAQTVLGVAVLVDLRITGREALLLLALFAAQFVLPAPNIRYVIACIYVVVTVAMFIRHRRHIPPLLRGI